MNSLMRATRQALQMAARSYATKGGEKDSMPRKVAILGAAGGIGQPLSLLMKVGQLLPLINELSMPTVVLASRVVPCRCRCRLMYPALPFTILLALQEWLQMSAT